MKKTYISPSFVMVRLNPSTSVLTGSTPDLNLNSLETTSTFDVKDNGVISDKDLWDDEW